MRENLQVHALHGSAKELRDFPIRVRFKSRRFFRLIRQEVERGRYGYVPQCIRILWAQRFAEYGGLSAASGAAKIDKADWIAVLVAFGAEHPCYRDGYIRW